MKSYNNLYQPMLDEECIKECFKLAAKDKRKKSKRKIKPILDNLDEEAKTLGKMLKEEMFIPDYHKKISINDGHKKKARQILKPSYKYEQVVHHCVIGQLKPIIMRGFYEFSCGSIPNRGIHYGKKYMRKWIDSYGDKKFYVLKMDIHHFFDSINRKILKDKLKEIIRDKRFYRLLCVLIEHDKVALVAKILADMGIEITDGQVKALIGYIAFDDAQMQSVYCKRSASMVIICKT